VRDVLFIQGSFDHGRRSIAQFYRLRPIDCRFVLAMIELPNQTFPGGRHTKSGKHQKWDRLFIRVNPADAPHAAYGS
jgi:hypothetical protein